MPSLSTATLPRFQWRWCKDRKRDGASIRPPSRYTPLIPSQSFYLLFWTKKEKRKMSSRYQQKKLTTSFKDILQLNIWWTGTMPKCLKLKGLTGKSKLVRSKICGVSNFEKIETWRSDIFKAWILRGYMKTTSQKLGRCGSQVSFAANLGSTLWLCRCLCLCLVWIADGCPGRWTQAI